MVPGAPLKIPFVSTERNAENEVSDPVMLAALGASLAGQSGAHGRETLPYANDPVKAEAAAIFRVAWEAVKADPEYQELTLAHKAKYG